MHEEPFIPLPKEMLVVLLILINCTITPWVSLRILNALFPGQETFPLYEP